MTSDTRRRLVWHSSFHPVAGTPITSAGVTGSGRRGRRRCQAAPSVEAKGLCFALLLFRLLGRLELYVLWMLNYFYVLYLFTYLFHDIYYI